MTWRDLWRDSLAPLLPTRGLAALAHALETGDPRVIRGATTRASNDVERCHDLSAPCGGACVLAYPLWQANDDADGMSVLEVERRFARFVEAMEEASWKIGVLTYPWDRGEITDAELLAIVDETLAGREAA